MKPITDSPIAINYGTVSEYLADKVIMTQAEYRERLNKSFESGKAVGYEYGYREGRLDLLITREENAACQKCFLRSAEINSDYCATCAVINAAQCEAA